jgi:hypothetical protein
MQKQIRLLFAQWSLFGAVSIQSLLKRVLLVLHDKKCLLGFSFTNLSFIQQGIRPKECEGPSNKSENCSTNPCDMQWSTWSNCSATCGKYMVKETHKALKRLLGWNDIMLQILDQSHKGQVIKIAKVALGNKSTNFGISGKLLTKNSI